MECIALAKLAEFSMAPKAGLEASAANAGMPASEAKACALVASDAIAAELPASWANACGFTAIAASAGLDIESAEVALAADAA